jgi:hypothetical protein
MRLVDWAYCCLSLCRSDLGLVIPPEAVAHAFHTIDLRRLHYMPMAKSRSRGYVLAVWCATASFSFSLNEYFGPEYIGALKSSGACSLTSIFGLYTSGCVNTAVVARVVSPEQGNCEPGEGAFKYIKKYLKGRTTYQWEAAKPMMRRHGLAHEITRVTNTIASDASDDMSSRMQDLYREINMGPETTVGGNGEVRPFSAKEVRSVFFVVMCLKWLPDYVIGHSTGVHTWWKDAEVEYAQGTRMLGRLIGGGVRPTSILCDFNATCGASIFDAAWLTERGLEAALLVHTKGIVANPGAYSLPGWESVQVALNFLKAEAKGEREGPLKAFLCAAGVP